MAFSAVDFSIPRRLNINIQKNTNKKTKKAPLIISGAFLRLKKMSNVMKKQFKIKKKKVQPRSPKKESSPRSPKIEGYSLFARNKLQWYEIPQHGERIRQNFNANNVHPIYEKIHIPLQKNIPYRYEYEYHIINPRVKKTPVNPNEGKDWAFKMMNKGS